MRIDIIIKALPAGQKYGDITKCDCTCMGGASLLLRKENIGVSISLAVWSQSAYQHHETLMAGKVSLDELQLLRPPLRVQGWPAVDFC